MTTSQITRKCATLLALGAVATAAVAPVATAMPGPSTPSETPVVQDLRSPDARDAASGYSPKPVVQAAVAQDLRSPDARDAAASYDPKPAPQPVSTGTGDDGFDWVSGAIGAAAIGGLILLLAFMRPGRTSGVGGRPVVRT